MTSYKFGFPTSIWWLKSLTWSVLSLTLLLGAIAQPTRAQPRGARAQTVPTAVTVNQPSQAGLTVPSLWWAAEQFGNKLLDRWSAYPQRSKAPGRVEIVVRPEIWRLLDYLERYAFVNQFGAAASDYGYNLQVFDREKNLLATYTCGFSQANPHLLEVRDFQGQPIPDYLSSNPPGKLSCRLRLNSLII